MDETNPPRRMPPVEKARHTSNVDTNPAPPPGYGQSTAAPSSGRPEKTTRALALVGGVCALLLLGLAAYFAIATYFFIANAAPREDIGLAGVGYILAGVAGLLAVLIAFFAATGYGLRRRAPRAALGLASTGAIGALVVLLAVLSIFVSGYVNR